MPQCEETHIQSFLKLHCSAKSRGSYKGQTKINTQCHLADQLVSQGKQAAQSQEPKCKVIAATLRYRIQVKNALAQNEHTNFHQSLP